MRCLAVWYCATVPALRVFEVVHTGLWVVGLAMQDLGLQDFNYAGLVMDDCGYAGLGFVGLVMHDFAYVGF